MREGGACGRGELPHRLRRASSRAVERRSGSAVTPWSLPPLSGGGGLHLRVADGATRPRRPEPGNVASGRWVLERSEPAARGARVPDRRPGTARRPVSSPNRFGAGTRAAGLPAGDARPTGNRRRRPALSAAAGGRRRFGPGGAAARLDRRVRTDGRPVAGLLHDCRDGRRPRGAAGRAASAAADPRRRLIRDVRRRTLRAGPSRPRGPPGA